MDPEPIDLSTFYLEPPTPKESTNGDANERQKFEGNGSHGQVEVTGTDDPDSTPGGVDTDEEFRLEYGVGAYDTDEFGFRYGDEDFVDGAWPEAREPWARRSVSRWTITAVGNRPEDYRARDVLYGQLYRDPRPRSFHINTKQPPDWMVKLTDHLPDDPVTRKNAINFLALHYQQKLWLADRVQPGWDCYDEEADQLLDAPWSDTPSIREQMTVLHKAWDCLPYTVQVRREFEQPIRPCGRYRHCPWCYARLALRLHDALRAGPIFAPGGDYFVLGKVEPLVEPYAGIHGDLGDEWPKLVQTDPTMDYGPERGYYGLSVDRLRSTRKALLAALEVHAKDLGVVTGLLTHQVGAGQNLAKMRTFRHVAAFFGVVDHVKRDELIGGSGDGLWNGFSTELTVGGKRLVVIWAVLPKTLRNLRYLLLGTASGYVPHGFDLPLQQTHRKGRPAGISGALSWEPTFLMDSEQWPNYLKGTMNLPLYQAVGSWKDRVGKAMAEVKKSWDKRFEGAQRKKVERMREEAKRRIQQQGNISRQTKSDRIFQDLLVVAREVWPEVQAHARTAKGKPPYRRLLVAALNSRGIAAVSDSHLRKLMAVLRS